MTSEEFCAWAHSTREDLERVLREMDAFVDSHASSDTGAVVADASGAVAAAARLMLHAEKKAAGWEHIP